MAFLRLLLDVEEQELAEHLQCFYVSVAIGSLDVLEVFDMNLDGPFNDSGRYGAMAADLNISLRQAGSDGSCRNFGGRRSCCRCRSFRDDLLLLGC